MIQKLFFTCVPMVLVAFAMSPQANAEIQFEGFIVQAIESELVIQEKDTGEYRTIIVENETEITLDGKPVRLEDLLPQFRVFVVADEEGDRFFAKKIEALSRGERMQSESEKHLHILDDSQ